LGLGSVDCSSPRLPGFLPDVGVLALALADSAAWSVVAWFRSRRDGLFRIGVALNGFLLLGFATKLTELDY
jgi:hypothetical protein